MKIVSGWIFRPCPVFIARRFALCIFTFCLLQNLGAQEGSYARIYYAEGVDFALTLGGVQTIFPAGLARGEGINLDRSSVINTGAGTFLEIQLIPSGTVIKLSENTSFIYNGIDDNGKFVDLGLLYGRIRVVTGYGMNFTGQGADPEGAYSIVIRGGGVSARIGEGDFGADYFLEPGLWNSASLPQFRLYSFRGSAEIFPYGTGAPVYFGGARNLALEGRECLSLDISPSYTYAEKKSLDGDISAYWNLHNFAGSPPVSGPDINIAEAPDGMPGGLNYYAYPPAAGDVSVPAARTQAAGNSQGITRLPTNRNKHIALAVGLFLTASSVAVQGICYSRFSVTGDELTRSYFFAAYPSLGLGLVCTLVGILYNPAVPVR